MTSEIIPVRKFRRDIPAEHKSSLDTRLLWLWNQRFGTVQMIWKESRDVLDHTAATLVLQCIMANDLESITQLFQRLEGGAIDDTVQLSEAPMRV